MNRSEYKSMLSDTLLGGRSRDPYGQAEYQRYLAKEAKKKEQKRDIIIWTCIFIVAAACFCLPEFLR